MSASEKNYVTPEDVDSSEPTDIVSEFSSLLSGSRLRGILTQLGWTLGSIVLAFLIAALVMIATGRNPNIAYFTLFNGALLNFDQVLWFATPLIFTGLSVAIAFQAGLFNIGAEGQLYMGSMAATMLGYMFALPIVAHPLACLAIGAITGGLYAFVPGLLKAYRGAHEVVTTMMLSYVAVLYTQWLVAGPLREPNQWNAQTPPLFPTAWLPKLIGSPFLNIGFILAVLSVVGVYIFLQRTVLGYEMRAVGKNPSAAEVGGVFPKRMVIIALAISGGLAGIAGAVEIMGYYHRFMDGWSAGLGFDGITVAVLGANNPWGVFGAALFFGFLKAGGIPMQTAAQVPQEMVRVIQGLVVLFVAAPKIIKWLGKRNIAYAKWVVKDPVKAVPFFLTAIMGLVGVLLGLGIGFTYFSINLLTTLILVIIGLLALVAVTGSYKTQKWGILTTFTISIVWIIVGVCNFIFELGFLLIPLLTVGIVGIIFSSYSFYLIEKKGVIMEVEV